MISVDKASEGKFVYVALLIKVTHYYAVAKTEWSPGQGLNKSLGSWVSVCTFDPKCFIFFSGFVSWEGGYAGPVVPSDLSNPETVIGVVCSQSIIKKRCLGKIVVPIVFYHNIWNPKFCNFIFVPCLYISEVLNISKTN